MVASIFVLVQFILTWLNHKQTFQNLSEAQIANAESQQYFTATLKGSQVVKSMGMLNAIKKKWFDKQVQVLKKQSAASDTNSLIDAFGKFSQLVQGSAMIFLGCWISLNDTSHDLTGGSIIFASILASRILQPLLSLTASWKTILDAKNSYSRLNALLDAVPQKSNTMALPEPLGNLSVQSASIAIPETNQVIVKAVSFELPAGKLLTIIGPSGSGKSTLARAIVGATPLSNGKIRLDGVDIHQWNKVELGPHIGYLPQDIELFDGTIAENIGRFSSFNLEDVRSASHLVKLTEIIENLPNGFSTEISEDGGILSGGHRQRLALARAIYLNPKLIVLDEPNSSLDAAGDLALIETLEYLKSQGTTIIVISHRSNLIKISDYLMLLSDGVIRSYGPRDLVMQKLQEIRNNNLKK